MNQQTKSPLKHSREAVLCIATCFTALTLAGGCSRPLGRVSVMSTTPAEHHSAGPSIAQFAEATDTAADSLRGALCSLVQQSEVCIVLGRTENQSNGVVPDTEVHIARERVLMAASSDVMTASRVHIHDGPKDPSRCRRRVRSNRGIDLLGRGSSTQTMQMVADNALSCFEFVSCVGIVERGTTRLAVYEFRLVRVSDGVRVWASRTESKRDGGERISGEEHGSSRIAREHDLRPALESAGDTIDLARRVKDISR